MSRITGEGALPAQTIKSLLSDGYIKKTKEENINPASLDLELSGEIYRTEGTFLPNPGEKVRDALEEVEKEDFTPGNIMEKDVVYIARLKEEISLPENVYGYCNPKSSTGRNNVHVRILADGVPRYDSLTLAGFSGEIWVSIITKSYPVKIPEGETLAQLRLFTKDTRFNQKELETSLELDEILWTHKGRNLGKDDIKISDNDGSIILTLDLKTDPVGWESLGVGNVMDFGKRDHYKGEEFFRELHIRDGRLNLRKGGFYILSTNEYVRVPPHLSCEMASMDERSGEFRSHRAGYIDPGWGYGKDGEQKGRPLTLEIEPFEDLIVRHKQPIARIRFEKMTERPEVLYDTASSNYTDQITARLSKHFKK